MIMSPDCMRRARACIVCSVGPPAGTISQAMHGLPSFEMKSSREDDAIAPSAAMCLTLSGLKSVTTNSWPPRIRRRVMLAPILPRPTIPSRMQFSLKSKNQPQRPPRKISLTLYGMRPAVPPIQPASLCRGERARLGGRARPGPGSPLGLAQL